MAMDVNTVRATIGTALEAITGLRVFHYIPDSAVPPAAMVGMPALDYDDTMQRGKDRAVFPVTVVVGKAHDRSAQDKLGTYMSGTGAATTSVKAAVDAIGPHVRVQRAEARPIILGAQEFLGATFDVDYIA